MPGWNFTGVHVGLEDNLLHLVLVFVVFVLINLFGSNY